MVPADRVRQIADEVLGAHLVTLGYRRGRGKRAGWTSIADGAPRLVELGFSKWNGTGPVAEFRVEVGAGRSHLPNAVPSLPMSLLLDDDALDEAGRLHDLVMAKARAAAPDADPRWYPLRGEPMPRGLEFFLPYADEDDVRMWLAFVIARLPAAMTRLERIVAETWGPATTEDAEPSPT